MILNMTGAGNGAQIIPFNVSESTDINNYSFKINNVKIPKGTVKGFFISATEGTVFGNMAVMQAFKYTNGLEQTEGQLIAVLYYSSESIYKIHYNHNTTFVYDDTNQTFEFKVSAYDVNAAYLPAGNYQLVIW